LLYLLWLFWHTPICNPVLNRALLLYLLWLFFSIHYVSFGTPPFAAQCSADQPYTFLPYTFLGDDIGLFYG